MKKRVVITGAAGFVGQNLIRRLVGLGYECHAFVRGSTFHEAHEKIGSYAASLRVVNLVEGGEVLNRAFSECSPDWVFHLAARGTRPSHPELDMLNVNVIGTWNVLNAVAECGVEKFVNAGASQEYGRRCAPTDEVSLCTPDTPYGVTKLAGTLMCSERAVRTGLKVVSLRLYSSFGPFEDRGRLIPQLIACGRDGRFPPLVSPLSARDYVYISDIIDGFILAAEYSGKTPEIFNLGSGNSRSLESVVSVAQRILRIPDQPRWESMEACQYDTPFWEADITKVKFVLGWHPEHSFEVGFEKTVRWWDERFESER